MKAQKLSNTKVISLHIMETAPVLMRKMRTHVMDATSGELTLTQYRILANIYRGINSITTIAERQSVAQPSMSKMIHIMMKRKLLKSSLHPEDRRQRILQLTKEGENLFLKIRKNAQNQMSLRLDDLDSKDLEILDRALLQIQKVLQKWS